MNRSAQKRWTDDEVETLVKLRKGGAYWKDIADILGRPRQSVERKWQRLDLPKTTPKSRIALPPVPQPRGMV